jgi:hypothetical protein
LYRISNPKLALPLEFQIKNYYSRAFSVPEFKSRDRMSALLEMDNSPLQSHNLKSTKTTRPFEEDIQFALKNTLHIVRPEQTQIRDQPNCASPVTLAAIQS